MGERIDYERWYPEVPAVMDTRQLADLLHTNEQIIRAWGPRRDPSCSSSAWPPQAHVSSDMG
ncbi:MAG: hypothetical protein WD313_03385 [Acidimicrobiia bacterium]